MPQHSGSRLLVGCTIALSMMIASACGPAAIQQPASNEYWSDLQMADQTTELNFDRVQATYAAYTAPSTDAMVLHDIADAVVTYQRAIQALRPPAAVTIEHSRLVTAVVELSTSVDSGSAGLPAPSDSLDGSLAEVQERVHAVVDACAELERSEPPGNPVNLRCTELFGNVMTGPKQ